MTKKRERWIRVNPDLGVKCTYDSDCDKAALYMEIEEERAIDGASYLVIGIISAVCQEHREMRP